MPHLSANNYYFDHTERKIAKEKGWIKFGLFCFVTMKCSSGKIKCLCDCLCSPTLKWAAFSPLIHPLPHAEMWPWVIIFSSVRLSVTFQCRYKISPATRHVPSAALQRASYHGRACFTSGSVGELWGRLQPHLYNNSKCSTTSGKTWNN